MKDSLTGTTLVGRYVVGRRLGMGGMGAVYLAKQEPLGREVALKVLRPSLVGDPVAVERFKNEAKIVAQLGHPHVVAIHEFGTTDDGILFIAMEYVAGKSLGEVLREELRLPWQRTIPIVRGVARALSAAHQRGIIHRDLKPDNIILADLSGMRDFVKVLDFGIAKLVKSEESKNLTGTGFVPGTPGYIAPELIMGAGGEDPRNDLYSLGITWFEMLTGRRPYDGDSAMKIFLAHLNEPVPKLDSALGVPELVEEILRGLLQKQLTERIASADKLLAAFDELAHAGLSIQTWPATPPPSPLVSASIEATLTAHATPLASSSAASIAAAPSTHTSDASERRPTGPTPSDNVAKAPPPAETVEFLLAQRRRWRRSVVIGAALIFAVGLLVGFAVVTQDNDAYGELPLHARFDADIRRDLSGAVDAYLRADRRQSRELTDRVLAAAPNEPGAMALDALLLDDFNTDERRRRVATAVSALTTMDRFPGAGAHLVTLYDAVLSKDPAAYEADVRECFEEECRDHGEVSAFASISVADLIFAGNVTRSLELLEETITTHPRVPMAHERKASLLLKIGRHHESLVAAEEGLRTNPGSPALLLVAGKAHLASGETRQGITRLRESFERGSGRAAQLALGHAYAVLGDEKKREQTIGALLLNASADEICHVAFAHAPALIGAARGQAALALYEACAKSGADRGLLLRAMIGATDAFESLRDLELWDRARDVALGALKESGAHDQRLETISLLGDCVAAAERGDREKARALLDQLKNDHPADQWPAHKKTSIIAHAESRVLALEGKVDEALQATNRIERACRVDGRTIGILVRAGKDEEAIEAIERLLEKKAYCRQDDFSGGYVLEALVLRAETLSKSKPEVTRAELRREIEALFPLAEPDGALMRRARAILGDDGQR